MSSLAAGNVRRIVSNPQASFEAGDVLILTDDRPAPADATVFRALIPGDLSNFIASLYGNPITAFNLLTTPWEMDHLSSEQCREIFDAIRAVSQQWGNSTIDGAHGVRNLLSNALTLLPSPDMPTPLTNSPIVAVGAGPSCQAMLEELRICGLPIVSCDAALKPLLDAGVPVEACTPLERLRSTGQKIPTDCKNVMFAGSPFCPPSAVQPFARHTYWPTCDPIYDWYGPIPTDFHPGTTSGTAAVAVALRLTNGPVYLVGHDLCGGHMAGASVSANLADPFDATRLGYNGELLPTKTAWLRAKFDIESMRTNRIINAAGHRGYGLRLDGIRVDALPKQDAIELHWPQLRNPKRHGEFMEKAAYLVDDMEAMATKAQSVATLQDCGLEHLINTRSLDPVAYMLRPLYAECSILRRLGREESDVVSLFKQAIQNIVHTVSGALRG